MAGQTDIAATLRARLLELRQQVERIDADLQVPLTADFEEQAVELENQDALAGIEHNALHEIAAIEAALKRIDEGSYGTCATCGGEIAPKRLAAMPTATRCMACAD